MEYIGSEKFHPGDAKWQGFESSHNWLDLQTAYNQ